MSRTDPAQPFEPERFGRPANAGRPVRRSYDLIPLSAIALVLLWLIFRVSVANALIEVRPDLGASLAPQNPQARVAALDLGRVSADPRRQDEAIRGLLTAEPLSDHPFLVAADEASRQGRVEADLLLEEVVRRNPRSRAGHLLRLDRQLRHSRVKDAAITTALLSRLLPESGRLLIQELARISSIPEARTAIAEIVERDSALRLQLLEALARQGASPDLIFGFAQPSDLASQGETARWQVMLLNELVARGEVSRAREAWNELTPTGSSSGLIYDPKFTRLPGPPPFNWHFEASAEGFAEPARGEAGLYVEYYGRRDTVLGAQLLTLVPGRYQLSLRAEGSADGQGGRLAWTVTCAPDKRQIASVPLEGIDASGTSVSGTFIVPAGCTAQWLRLTGKFGEFPKDQRVTIRELRLASMGQS